MGESGQRLGVERFRVTPMIVTAGLVLTCSVVVFAMNMSTQRTPVILSWIPYLIETIMASVACWRGGDALGLEPHIKRLWRQLGIVNGLVTLGIAGDTLDVLRDPTTLPDHHRPVVSVIYVMSALALLFALLRLPVQPGYRREQFVRFSLDSATVTITITVFAWYFAFRHGLGKNLPVHTVVPMIVLASLGLISALAALKAAISGMSGLDRPTVRLLALSAAVSSCGGGLLPLLSENHTQSSTQLSVPAGMFIVVLAVDRQRRAANAPRHDPPRRIFSVVPYAAVTATDCLLLVVGREAGTAVLVTAIAAVGLTALVVVRQLAALRDNGRLLRRVDANLLELSRYQERLTHRATHDDLTGLANRSLFELKAGVALTTVEHGDTLSLALIDLDDFKAVNDRLGHAVGDAMLVVVADRLRDCVRTEDVVARLGGDEFGLLLRGLRGAEATEVLERVADALSRPVHAAGHDLLVQASIGLAEAWAGAAPQELLRRADLAMYAAKERGKSRHAVYDAELEQHQAADAQLGAELRQALDRSEFFLVYQPIVRLPDGEWTGLEALVRWRHPERGLVGPDTFIPIAERTGLIVPLGDWILRTASAQAAGWLAEYGAGAPGEIGVNVSARQLREPGFADDVSAALEAAQLPARRLVVEVTETAVFDGGVALETVRAVAKMGARVALDDFGTGHSSLGLLRICPADTLKVDKSFVDDIGGATDEAVIATALIQITNGLHLDAVAEGVETAEQARTLHGLGYRFAQGYHFSRPLTAEQVKAKLDADRDSGRTLAGTEAGTPGGR